MTRIMAGARGNETGARLAVVRLSLVFFFFFFFFFCEIVCESRQSHAE